MEVSQNAEGENKSINGTVNLERSVNELQPGLITDIKEDDTKDSLSVQPSSSSGCVDEYLADPVEADCANSAYNVNLKQSNNLLESSASGLLDSKNLKFDEKNDEGSEVDVAQMLPGQSEEGLGRKLISDVKQLKIRNEQHCSRGIYDDLSYQEKECKNLDPQVMIDFCLPKSCW